MPLKAYLQFGNNEIGKYSKEYLLKEVKFRFIRNHTNYRPSDDGYCESIWIALYPPEKEDPTVFKWFISGESLDGRIIIELTDPLLENEERFTEIQFENAVCFDLQEDYEIENKLRVINIGLIAEETKVEDIKFSR